MYSNSFYTFLHILHYYYCYYHYYHYYVIKLTLDGCSYIQGLCNVVAVTNSKPNGQVHETKTQRGEKKGSHVLQHLHITSQNDPDSQGLQNCSEAVLCLVVLVSAAVPSDLLLCCCLSGFLCSCTVYCF